MALYRKHRGTLEESLKTTIIVRNWEELKKAIFEDWEMWRNAERADGTKLTDNFTVKIEPYYGDCDYRCGWYTQIVSANIENINEFHACGFLSEPLHDK